MSIDITQHSIMSSYTIAEVRKMVDDVDEIIRAAVVNGDIARVFVKERAALVRKLFNYHTMRTKSFTGQINANKEGISGQPRTPS